MNVLFYYDNACGPDSHGGTEVATFRIAKALKESGGYNVFNAFLHGKTPDGMYEDTIKLHKSNLISELAAFLKDHDIDVVVNMGRFFRQKKLKAAIERSERDLKLIFMHHFAPGSEKKKPTYKAGLRLFRLDPFNPLYWLRATLYPIMKLPRTLNWGNAYRSVYEFSDRVILLSPGYEEEYLKIAGMNKETGNKLVAIPNIFDPDEPATKELPKEKRVVILSRMDEIQKRISLALKIWKDIESKEDLEEWQLDIVGSGHELKALKKLGRRLGLKRAVFHGWGDGKQFLRNSPVLMSTSDYEGLSLAMIEAQYYGTIPVAFDSYASLRDIVSDGSTGIIVENDAGIKGYAERLASLMRDEEMRSRMSRKCRENSRRFDSRTVSEKWRKLLESL